MKKLLIALIFAVVVSSAFISCTSAQLGALGTTLSNIGEICNNNAGRTDR